MIVRTHTILYVSDQESSARFYATVLELQPALHVPGMTEFHLGEGNILGLMPEAGINRLLGDALPDPAAARGIPRAEIYLVVIDAQAYYRRALAAGARNLSGYERRDWGDFVAYCLDSDGHVLAFAEAPPT